jgi:hypothetical protein
MKTIPITHKDARILRVEAQLDNLCRKYDELLDEVALLRADKK